MNEVDKHRSLLQEAERLEHRRRELVDLAKRGNVADLLPVGWMAIEDAIEDLLDERVEVCFYTSLKSGDAERFSERDCRNFMRFVIEVADDVRLHSRREETE